MGFCEIEDLEAFLQIDIPATKYAAAWRAITEATGAIQGYCHQTLELVEDDKLTLDVPVAVAKLLLPEMPVVDVSEVIEDGETLVADDDYKLGRHGILHRVDANWATGVQILTVTYDHGYDADEIPDAIVQVCASAASRRYQAGLRSEEMGGIPGVQAMSLGDYSVQFGGETGNAGESTLGASAAPILLASEKRLLDPYRYKP